MERKSRNTKQKDLLNRELEKFHSFFTAEELFEDVKKTDRTIGMATIYRFLKDLKKKGRIYFYSCDRKTIYSKEKSSHCHFICDKTGKTLHFDINNLDFLSQIKKQIPGKIKNFQLEIHGTCKDCS
jgi:Fe2+ or Zn2+ uptake regulation protein